MIEPGDFMTLTKSQTAARLAHAHYELDAGVLQVFRIRSDDDESDNGPIRLLEVNDQTPEAGIAPVFLPRSVNQGVVFPLIVVEVSPREFELLQRNELSLPDGWRMGEELPRRNRSGAA